MSLQLFYTDKVPSELKKLAVICHEGRNTQLTNDILFSGLDATGSNKFEIWQTTSEVYDSSFKDFYIKSTKDYMFGCFIANLKNNNFEDQLYYFYDEIFKFTEETNFNIAKIWHYIPHFLKKRSDGKNNYDLMCEVRKKIYAKNRISDCYPASTAVSIKNTNLVIYFIATPKKIIEVKNVNQTAPYKYPSGYVSTHPLFSRAILIDKEEKIFVSGTASIEGHETKHHGNIELQYEQICKNLKSLIKNYDINEEDLSNVKIYLSSNAMDAKLMRKFYDKYKDKFITIESELCRENLLIEIDGIY